MTHEFELNPYERDGIRFGGMEPYKITIRYRCIHCGWGTNFPEFYRQGPWASHACGDTVPPDEHLNPYRMGCA